MLEGLQWCFCTRCKPEPIFPTCPGFRFCGPRNTFYAHARYLVMVRRRFYGKKHCFIHVLQQPSQQNTLIINVFETSSHKTLQNTLFLITRGSPRRLFMHMRDTWWWWAVLYIIKPLFLLRVVLGFYPSPLGWHCRADIRTLNFLHCLMSAFFRLPVNNAKICATCESLAFVIEPAHFEPWKSVREDSRRNVSSVVRFLQNN